MAKKRIIGIDLGTTNSCVAVWQGTTCKVIENLEGNKITPSVVAYTPTGLKIGDIARRQAALCPKETIGSVKRLMGETYSSVQPRLSQFSFEVVNGRKGFAAISLGNTRILPQEVSAEILRYLKTCAEKYLDEEVTEAVITVPAHFSEVQRKATMEAADIAGLQVRRIVNEPTAAALAYGLSNERQGNVIVFDLGGGTFDLSLLDCSKNIYAVAVTGGNKHLGGDDIDSLLVQELSEDFLRRCEPGISICTEQMVRLREAAENAKKELSFTESTEISLPWLAPESKVNPHFVQTLTRHELEEIAAPLVNQCREICIETLSSKGIPFESIEHVLLVGGATKMPCIRRMVEELFGKKPSYEQDADQIVAVGAAIEGAIISGTIHDKVLLDVTPLALGLITQGCMFDVVIEPNTTIPTSKTIRYRSAKEGQKAVSIIVAQGKNAYDPNITKVGYFDLTELADTAEGMPFIDVTFDIDQSGLLTVSARDVQSGSQDNRSFSHPFANHSSLSCKKNLSDIDSSSQGEILRP